MIAKSKLIATVGLLCSLFVTNASAQGVVRSVTPDSTWNETVIAPQCVVSVNPATINAGQTSNVTVSTCGSPTNPPNQYRWTVTNSGPTASNTGDTYTFPTAGTYCYTVRAASVDGWGKQSPQACVTVNAGCPATSTATSPAVACGTGYTGDKFTTYTTTYGPAPACTPTTSSSEDTSGCVAIGCPATSTTTSTAACGAGYTGNKVTTTTTTYGAAPACTPTTSSSEDTSGCVAIGCLPSSVTTSTAACGAGYTGNKVTTYTTTYGAAPACTPTTSSSEDTSGCACENGATNYPFCTFFTKCTLGACPAGSTDDPAGCVVESSIQNCTGGRSTIQSQYNYYLPNLDAPGPGTCPWIPQSKALICGGCTTPGHTFNPITQNCEAPAPTTNATRTVNYYFDSTYSGGSAHSTISVICDNGKDISLVYGSPTPSPEWGWSHGPYVDRINGPC